MYINDITQPYNVRERSEHKSLRFNYFLDQRRHFVTRLCVQNILWFKPSAVMLLMFTQHVFKRVQILEVLFTDVQNLKDWHNFHKFPSLK